MGWERMTGLIGLGCVIGLFNFKRDLAILGLGLMLYNEWVRVFLSGDVFIHRPY